MTQQGGAQLDPRHRHNISFTREGTDSSESALKEYRDQGVAESELRLRDGSMFRYTPDFGDDISLAICSVFPNACFQQIRNSLAARQIRPRGVDDFELFWTIFGYEDDTPEMANDRMIQTNMIGPAGLVSMEDGEAVEIAHRSSTSIRVLTQSSRWVAAARFLSMSSSRRAIFRCAASGRITQNSWAARLTEGIR